MPETNKLTLKQKKFVSALLGEANGNATEAARLAGYEASTRNTLEVIGYENIRKPQIQREIDEAQRTILRRGIALKQVRLNAAVRRHQLMEQVIAERAARHSVDADTAAESAKRVFGSHTPPEAATGLVVREETISPGGTVTTKWSVDTGLLKELREHEKQVAHEVGEWTEKREDTLSGDSDFLAALRAFGRASDG